MTLPTSSVAPRGRGGSLATVALLLAGAIAVGGVAFAIGRTTAPAATGRSGLAAGQAPAGGFPGGQGVPSGSFAPGTGGFPGGGAFGAGALTVTGTVTQVDGSSLTLALSSGATMVVAIDASTTYHGQVAAMPGDVEVGREVVVQLGGLGAGGPAGGAARASASPAPGASAPAPAGSGAPGAGFAPGSATARDITIAAP